MSRNYDNWEKLMDAVTKRRDYLQLAHAISRSPSTCSEESGSSSSSNSSSPLHDVAFQIGGSSSTLKHQIKAASQISLRSFGMRAVAVLLCYRIGRAPSSTQKEISPYFLKKVVMKIEILSDESRNKAMKTLARISGVTSITMNMKEKRLTVVVGKEIDPILVVAILRKSWYTQILSVGPDPETYKENIESARIRSCDD